ncbi:Sorting nexin-2 [Fukomys damarensis]|uniref:Sorting nexin-2 n=1 Tax=Fukomys damarensis TaxID=885580 RepID=A0A091DNT8_FUKDA|nr:Sorting nexin-2 [Fukomys damarensis]
MCLVFMPVIVFGPKKGQKNTSSLSFDMIHREGSRKEEELRPGDAGTADALQPPLPPVTQEAAPSGMVAQPVQGQEWSDLGTMSKSVKDPEIEDYPGPFLGGDLAEMIRGCMAGQVQVGLRNLERIESKSILAPVVFERSRDETEEANGDIFDVEIGRVCAQWLFPWPELLRSTGSEIALGPAVSVPECTPAGWDFSLTQAIASALEEMQNDLEEVKLLLEKNTRKRIHDALTAEKIQD